MYSGLEKGKEYQPDRLYELCEIIIIIIINKKNKALKKKFEFLLLGSSCHKSL